MNKQVSYIRIDNLIMKVIYFYASFEIGCFIDSNVE